MSDLSTDRRSTAAPTGYATHDMYFASHFYQGGRRNFFLDLSIPQLLATINQPDPLVLIEGNRQITLSHAQGFADYILSRPDWVCPMILLRAPTGEFEFRSTTRADESGAGTDFGILSVPKYARTQINIIDGQHRILGFHLAWTQLEDQIQKARAHLARAKKDQPDVHVLIKSAEKHLDMLLKRRQTLTEQRVGLQIVITDDPKEYKQIFVDIADNAKGIPKAVSVGFDSHKVVYRAFAAVAEHPLLKDRVNKNSDRAIKNSPYLLGAAHVANIIRCIEVGSGRISRVQELELKDADVVKNSLEFFNVITAAFPNLKKVEQGILSPEELRQQNLLGSVTMLRVLARVFHDLREEGLGLSDILAHFEGLAPLMPLPLQDFWLTTGVFQPGGTAPGSAAGDVNRLTDAIKAKI
jgi:hypothetical protein